MQHLLVAEQLAQRRLDVSQVPHLRQEHDAADHATCGLGAYARGSSHTGSRN